MAQLNGTETSVVVDRSLLGCRLTEITVTSITDAQTLVTGIPGIIKVMTRNVGTPSTDASMSLLSNATLSGAVSVAKMTQAIVTDQATGEVTFDVDAGTNQTNLMIWSRG